MVDAPHGKLVLIFGLTRVRGVTLSILDGERVFNQFLFGTIETDTEDTGINNLVHPLIELEQNDIQIERGRDFLADFAQ